MRAQPLQLRLIPDCNLALNRLSARGARGRLDRRTEVRRATRRGRVSACGIAAVSPSLRYRRAGQRRACAHAGHHESSPEPFTVIHRASPIQTSLHGYATQSLLPRPPRCPLTRRPLGPPRTEVREGRLDFALFAGCSRTSISPPARRQPLAASHVRGGRTGAASAGGVGVRVQPLNHGPELRGSMAGAARRCLRKLSNT
jgi:hypothetical protein